MKLFPTPLPWTHVSFDCYGTLIDWERGILSALPGELDAVTALQRFVESEARLEAGPYLRYRDVLAKTYSEITGDFSAANAAHFAASVPDWPTFPDTERALQRLEERFRLVLLSNVDDDLIAGTQRQWDVEFSAVFTAEQIGSYKPSERNFEFLFERLGVGPERVLHVAQSLYHDHRPAKSLGFQTVHIERLSRLGRDGLAPPVDANPDWVFPDMATFVERLFDSDR